MATNMRFWIGMPPVLLLIAAATAADKSVLLQAKFEPGVAHYVTQDDDITQTVTMGDDEPGQIVKVRQLTGLIRKVLAVKEGDAKLSFTYDRVMMSFGGGGPMPAMSYDSKGDANPDGEMLEPLFKPMLGQEIEVVVGPDGRAKSTSGMKKIVERIDEAASDNMLWPQLRDGMTDASFQVQTVNAPHGALPNKRVEPGATWTTTRREDLPQLGTVEFKYECKLAKVETRDGKQMATIDYSCVISGDKKAREAAGGMSMTFDSGKSKGQATFNVDAGVVEANTGDTELLLSLSADGGPTLTLHVRTVSKFSAGPAPQKASSKP